MTGRNKPSTNALPPVLRIVCAVLETLCRHIARSGIWLGMTWAKAWNLLADVFRDLAGARN